MSRGDGGAAFPVPEIRADGIGIREGWDGMTLRDYFAAKELTKAEVGAICAPPECYARVADHCYRMADAMLAERSKS